MRARTLVLATAAAAALVAGAGAQAQDAPVPDAVGGDLYVTAGAVHTGTGQVFRPGAVAVSGGKIVEVGAPGDVGAPAGAQRIDAGDGAHVIPGLVAAWSEHVAAGGRDPASVHPDVRAIDGYDFQADESRLLAGGVTTVLISPGSTQVCSGHAAIVKTAGATQASRTLSADAGLVTGVGDGVQTPPAVIEPPDLPDAAADPLLPHRSQLPVTRAGSLLLLRRLVERGRAGDQSVRAATAGELPFIISARSSGDLEAAIAFLREHGLTNAIVVGATEAFGAADALAEAGLPVVLHWPGRPGTVTASDDPEVELSRIRSRENAAILSRAGVTFALSVGDEAALPDLLFAAASAVRAGLTAQDALAAVTSRAAEILGVGARVGSLATGHDGDLVVLSGAPADLRSVPLTTVVDGRVAWERKTGSRTVVVRAAELHVGDGRVIAPGEIAIEDGKIVEVGPTVGIPPGARVIDLGAGTVMPGLIDAFSHAGLAGAGGKAGLDLTTATTASKAVDSGDPAFALLAGAGVTTILAAPGGAGRVAGRASVVKTAGPWPGRRVIRADAGMVVRLLGETDIDAAGDQLAAAIKKARSYREGFTKYEKELKEYQDWKKKQDEAEKKAAAEKKDAEKKDAGKKDAGKKDAGKKDAGKSDGKAPAPEEKKDAKKEPAKKPEKKEPEKKTEPRKPTKDESQEGWAAVLDGKAPLFVQARTVEEIRRALKVLVTDSKLKAVVVGGDEARRVRGVIQKAKAGVIASPTVIARDRGGDVNLLRELALSGLPAAVGSDAYLGGSELLDVLAYAVRRGLSPAAAVKLVTGDAAKLLGVERRVGTLAPGKDADLVLLTAPPFAAGSDVLAVYVSGEEVQSDLR